jgi:hypothetical protein
VIMTSRTENAGLVSFSYETHNDVVNKNSQYKVRILKLITAAARNRASGFSGRSNTGMVGSNPTLSMDVCLHILYVVFSCVCRGFAMG